MKQSKLESFTEACVNTIVGFLITITFLPIVNYICQIEMNAKQMSLSTFLFTIISVARGYFIRRFFNNLQWLKDKAKKLVNKFTNNKN